MSHEDPQHLFELARLHARLDAIERLAELLLIFSIFTFLAILVIAF